MCKSIGFEKWLSGSLIVEPEHGGGAIMPDLSPQEIQALQGTRNSEVPPWMSYAAEFEETLDPKLEAAIEEYSQRRHEKSSSQNEEELCRQREINDEIAKQYQWLDPSDYANEEERVGRVMHSSQFINLLRSAGIKCWYRDHPQPGKITLVVQRDGQAPEVGCWVQHGFTSELSLMYFDEHDIPVSERRRGWRTCLLQLILKGIITEEKAHAIFGRPGNSEAWTRYNGLLYEFRNRRLDVI
jgi:hypothetical protein